MASYSYDQAARLFQEAVDRAEVTQGSQKTWAVTYINLGTSLRKLKYVAVAPIPDFGLTRKLLGDTMRH